MRTSHDIAQVAMVREEFTPLCYDLPYVNNNCHNLQAIAQAMLNEHTVSYTFRIVPQ